MTRARPDLSTKLVHLVKGDTMDMAFETLLNILNERQLKGGNGNIKGGHNCVCFTETPLPQLALSLSNRRSNKFKYRALGILVDKAWAFGKGARPAIYQPDNDYNLLHETIKYRHVRYEPHNITDPVDFTWEREWRLKANNLSFSEAEVAVIVPKRRWADALMTVFLEQFRDEIAGTGEQTPLRQPWHVIALSDLGIDVPEEI